MRTRALWIIGAIVLVVVLGIAAFLYLGSFSALPPEPDPIVFPVATSTDPLISGSPAISIPLRDGTTATVQNFIANGVTTEDPANDGNYYLAGEVEYCDEPGPCPGTIVTNDYSIVYFSREQAFSIGLEREPLGEVRRDAEAFLMQTLGINQTQMCALNYYLGTTVHVNETYGSLGNLGFSFCPGAVPLP